MEAGLFIIVAGIGYILNKKRSDKERVPSALTPIRGVSLDAAKIEQVDRPSMHDQYHSDRIKDVYAEELKRLSGHQNEAMGPMMNSSLSGQKIMQVHNNMSPYFSGSAPPGADIINGMMDGINTTRLEMFTGAPGVLPINKRESESLFKPTSFRVGTNMDAMDHVRSNYMDSVQLPRNRANELPFKQEIVGRPGVRGGKTGDVYFDEREFTLPPTIDNLRSCANPKESYQGRFIPGSSTTSTNRPKQGPIVENKKNSLIREQKTADDFFRTTGSTTQRTIHPVYNAKTTERQSTLRPYAGGVSRATPASSLAHASDTSSVMFRTPLGSLPVGHAVTTVKEIDDYGKGNILVYGNERDVTGARTRNGNLTTAVKAIIAPIQDLLKTSKKEEMISGPRRDGNIVGSRAIPKLTVYDSQDVAKTTRKETGIHDVHQCGAGMRPTTVMRGQMVDPDNIAKTTLKEDTVDTQGHDKRNAFLGRANTIVDKEIWSPAPTLRETVQRANAGGADGMISGSLQHTKTGAYTISMLDPARTTQKSMLSDTGTRYGVHHNTDKGGYTIAHSDGARETMRHTMVDNDYYGGQAGSVVHHMSESKEAYANANMNCEREHIVSNDRELIGSSIKLASSQREFGSETVDIDPMKTIERGFEHMIPDCPVKGNHVPHKLSPLTPINTQQPYTSNTNIRVEQDRIDNVMQLKSNPFVHDISK